MQHRMKTHQLTNGETKNLLAECLTGTLATVNSDGTPYNVPVHYVFHNNTIYIHGLPAGQKIENLKRNSQICFNVYEMRGLLIDREEKPCDTNTAYASVVIQGTAQLVEDMDEKKTALSVIIQKYTPHLKGKEIPVNMLKGTAVIKLSVCEMIGKYYA